MLEVRKELEDSITTSEEEREEGSKRPRNGPKVLLDGLCFEEGFGRIGGGES